MTFSPTVSQGQLNLVYAVPLRPSITMTASALYSPYIPYFAAVILLIRCHERLRGVR